LDQSSDELWVSQKGGFDYPNISDFLESVFLVQSENASLRYKVIHAETFISTPTAAEADLISGRRRDQIFAFSRLEETHHKVIGHKTIST